MGRYPLLINILFIIILPVLPFPSKNGWINSYLLWNSKAKIKGWILFLFCLYHSNKFINSSSTFSGGLVSELPTIFDSFLNPLGYGKLPSLTNPFVRIWYNLFIEIRLKLKDLSKYSKARIEFWTSLTSFLFLYFVSPVSIISLTLSGGILDPSILLELNINSFANSVSIKRWHCLPSI